MSQRVKMSPALIALVAIIIFTAWVLFPNLPLNILRRVFNYAARNLIGVSGLSPWLIKGILVFVLLPFYWALMEISKINLHLFKRKKSHKTLAKFVIVAYVGLFFLAMFFLSRGKYFDPGGKGPTKVYAVTPEGIRWFDSQVEVDPVYGIKTKRASPEFVEKYRRAAMGIRPKRIEYSEAIEFFDSIFGSPKVWYYLNPNGEHELFDSPGFHPRYKKELLPIDPEVVNAIEMKAKEEKDQKAKEEQKEAALKQKEIDEQNARNRIAYLESYINLSFTNSEEMQEISVLVIDEDQKELEEIEQEIASLLRTKSRIPVLSLFRRPFIEKGLFNDVFSGNARWIIDLELSKRCDYLILGKTSISFKPSAQFENLISAELNLGLKIISTDSGTAIESRKLSAVGAGFSNSKAEVKAIQAIKRKIDNSLREVF